MSIPPRENDGNGPINCIRPGTIDKVVDNHGKHHRHLHYDVIDEHRINTCS